MDNQVQISEEERRQIGGYARTLDALTKELNDVATRCAEMRVVINTAWKAAYRRVQLADESLRGVEIPDMIDESGKLQVNMDEQGIVSWGGLYK